MTTKGISKYIGVPALLGYVAVLCTPQMAQAALLPISNVPLFLTNSAKPNVMYTLDNSGSMNQPYMPDQDFTPAYNGSTTAVPLFKNCYWNSAFNDVYYDPTITYAPPLTSTGTPFPNASFTAAWLDGYYNYDGALATTLDLATVFADYQSLSSKFYYINSQYNGTRITKFAAPTSPDARAAFYYNYAPPSGSTDPATPAANTCYTNADYTRVAIPDPTASSTVQAAQMQNFANWFSYYRTRILMTKSALGASFSTLNSQYRVGFSTIDDNTGATNTSAANFIPLNDFTTTQKQTWFNNLYAIAPGGGTPLQLALSDDGEYYKGNGMAGSTAPDPVQYSCQQNFTMLSTDGFWNGSTTTVQARMSPGDWDNTILQLPEPVTLPGATSPLVVGNQWPAPYYEGPTATTYTLADVAMYYWDTDLRPTMTDDVPTSPDDPASWQHMTTFTIGLGAQGLLTPADWTGLQNGTVQWPVPTANALTTIDDLWHAGVNGHGQYLSAKNPALLTQGIQNILNTITNRTGSAAAVALNSGSYTSNSHLYQGGFNSSDWSGQLLSYPILSTGNLGPADWNSGSIINTQNFNTGRNIITDTGGTTPTGIPFRWANLTAAEQAALNTSDTGVVDNEGSPRLDYLRGDPTNEGTLLDFRIRPTSKLGDIIDSAPIYVAAPDLNYPDTLGPVPYSAFVTTYSGREPMIYVGANDGMLHGFDATSGQSVSGREQIAFVPAPVYHNLSALTDPAYSHHWYVDGSPTVEDVYWGTGTGAAWHTVLVGGLNGGGEGYYALDITDPTKFSEANAATLNLWDFTSADDADLGDTYAQPSVVLMANGDWAAVVGNGYNSTQNTGATGHAVLYILNIQTGAVLAKIDTGFGSTTAPDGLSTASVITATGSNVASYIYAGDIDGNMWKFDVTSSNPVQWKVAYTATGKPAPLYRAVDSLGNAQPITTAPQVGAGPSISGNPTGYMVYFGTGSYFQTGDTTSTNTQTFYGIWDNGAAVPNRVANPSALVQQTMTVVAVTNTNVTPNTTTNYRVISNNPVNYVGGGTPPLGWYIDLTLGERSVTNSLLRGGRIIFTTTIPSTVTCSYGGTSWLMELDAFTGGQLSSSPFDVNGDGQINAGDLVTLPNGTTAPAGGMQMSDIVSAPAVQSPTNGQGPETKFFNTSSGTVTHVLESSGAITGRVSWEQLQ